MRVQDAKDICAAVGGNTRRVHAKWWMLNLMVAVDRDTMVEAFMTEAAYTAIARGLEDVPAALTRHIYWVRRASPSMKAVAAIHHAGLVDDGPCVDGGNVLWHARRGLGAHLPEVQALLAIEMPACGHVDCATLAQCWAP